MGLSGLEPPTSRLSGVRSNQLSYKPIFFYKSGSHLLSHAVSSIVPSAAYVLTIVFGMRTGVPHKRIATRILYLIVLLLVVHAPFPHSRYSFGTSRARLLAICPILSFRIYSCKHDICSLPESVAWTL